VFAWTSIELLIVLIAIHVCYIIYAGGHIEEITKYADCGKPVRRDIRGLLGGNETG
jgi:hypothetical protein